MSLTSYELFNIWFPAIVVALAIAALWDFVRRRFWLSVSRFCPGILREVGLDSRYQSRAEAEDHHREITEKLNVFARVMNLLVSPKLSNSVATTAFDVEAQMEINPHHATPVIRMTGTSAVEGTYTISSSSENRMYPGKTIEGVDCRPVTIIYTAYFPDGTPKDVTRPAKRLFKMHANGPVKRIKSSIILQASIAIDPWVLAEIVELAKHCIQKEKRCIFQLGNWAILYHNAGEVQMHLLKEGDVPVNVEARWQDGKTGITMRGLYLTGSQVKVGTKRSSKILQSAGPATQGAGDLGELHLPTGEFDVPGEDSLIYASKIVAVDGVSLIVRSEASFILPPREENSLIEVVWTRWLRISNYAKKMLQSLLFGAEDCLPERAVNRPELEFDPEQLELSVEHWKGLSEIELLNTRKELLLFLQEQGASGIIERAGPPSSHSHFIFVRDEHYLECWREGLRVLNEVIHRNSNDSHSHTQIRVRGGIHFLLGDFECALQDYDLAHLNTGGHQSTVLLERALVKCKLGRYSEAMQDVVAVITLNPNVNDIQELQACIQQILDQQRPFRIDTAESGPSLLPDQEKAMVEIPDLLTGDEWHSGEIGSLRPMSDAGTARESVDVARTADWSLTSIAKALKLQLMLSNSAESLGMKPRYHVRRISCIVNILEDLCDLADVVKPLSMEDEEMLNWQAPTEDLQDDFRVRDDLSSLSGRLCPYKNISLSLYDKVTADEGHEQRREPLPLSGYRHVSFRKAMLTNHSAADGDGDVQTLFLYDGTPPDRSLWRWRSHDYIKELVHPGARSPYRAFWLVQWDVLDMWHVVQGDPNRGLCLNQAAAVECQDDGGKLHSIGWSAEVDRGGACSPASDNNGLNRHCGSDARTNPKMSIPVNEKPQTSLQTQPLRAPGVDSVFPTISENSTSGGDWTEDSSSMNAYEWKSGHNFHYHNGDEEAVSEVLRPADIHRISEEWNQKDETRSSDGSINSMAPPAVTSTMEDTAALYMKSQKISDQAWNCNASPQSVAPSTTDPLNWAKTAANLQSNHLDEIKRMVATYFNSTKVAIEGVNLSVGQVTAVVRRPAVQVVLDAANAKALVDKSSNWVLNKIMNGGDTHVTPKLPLRGTMTTSGDLEIENGLQVTMKRGGYHDLSRSAIEQESAVLAMLRQPNIIGFMKNSTSNLGSWKLMEGEVLMENPAELMEGEVLMENPAELMEGEVMMENPAELMEGEVMMENPAELMEDYLRSKINSRLKGLPEGSTPFSWPETRDIMLQIAASKASWHGHNVAHRDLKCQNILWRAPLHLHTLPEPGLFRPYHNLLVKLGDFGLVKSRIPFADRKTPNLGTGICKASEIFQLRDLAEDIYHFGVTCCVILSGESPYEDYWHQGLSLSLYDRRRRRSLDNLVLRDAPEALSLHASRRPLDNLLRLRDDVPEAVKKLIHQCLDSNPALRPTFEHIVMMLRECKPVQAHENTIFKIN